ncbi:hypothetical protein PNOK_0853800 [Pyrrhoderma noxium]|uniref:Uncharacterized protein n=1 Tax=Pyrrhoderma noxium TaxID=2282107 RepID=A0A286U7Y0_9AGAM|nr:hypothetical protein PNOK_0853800 [Pyrrhoderma noxium]
MICVSLRTAPQHTFVNRLPSFVSLLCQLLQFPLSYIHPTPQQPKFFTLLVYSSLSTINSFSYGNCLGREAGESSAQSTNGRSCHLKNFRPYWALTI